MIRRIFSVFTLSLICLGAAISVMAQFRAVTNADRETVRRELEYKISKDRNANIQVRVETVDVYDANGDQISVRGRAFMTERGGQREEISYDMVINNRRDRATRVEYTPARDAAGFGGVGGFGNQGRPNLGNGGYNGNYGGASSGPVRNGRYEIELVATRRMLDAGSGIVVQTSGRNSRTQQWNIEEAGGGFYYIRSAATGEAMTASNRGGSGATVVLAPMSRSADQQWEIRSGPDNGYYFINRRGKALDSPSSARDEGGRLQVYDSNDGANQRFILRPLGNGYQGAGQGAGRNNDRYDNRNRGQYDDSANSGFGSSGPGSLIWRARVDGEIELQIRDGSVRERLISGQPVYGASSQFSSALPRTPVNVRVEKRQGRGSVDVIEQPSARNGYTAVIRIRDTQGGADDYELEVRWN